jgi:hypothetical protein
LDGVSTLGRQARTDRPAAVDVVEIYMSKPLVYEINADVSDAEKYLQDVQRRMISGEIFDRDAVRDEAMRRVKIDITVK